MLEEQKPTMLQLRGHAVVLSPANDSLAHRVQGRDLDAVFDEGALSEVHVVGNGEVTTFDVPEKGVVGNIRINSALCASLVMTIRDQKLTGINLQQHPRGTIQTVNSNTPLDAFHIEVFLQMGLGKLGFRPVCLNDMPYLRASMAKDPILEQVEGLFEAYLEQNGHWKTPERLAILQQIYAYEGHFDVDRLYAVMEMDRIVSHAPRSTTRWNCFWTATLCVDINLANMGSI